MISLLGFCGFIELFDISSFSTKEISNSIISTNADDVIISSFLLYISVSTGYSVENLSPMSLSELITSFSGKKLD